VVTGFASLVAFGFRVDELKEMDLDEIEMWIRGVNEYNRAVEAQLRKE
jgi:hypothetical protein